MKMNIRSLKLLVFLMMAGTVIPLSPLSAAHSEKPTEERYSLKKVRQEIKAYRQINQEDYRPGKKEMEMDGLSLAAHISATAGLASFFLLPPLSLLLLPAGFIMGMIAWRSKRRYEHRRGRGLALAAIAVGGAFTLAVTISLAAFFLTFGIF